MPEFRHRVTRLAFALAVIAPMASGEGFAAATLLVDELRQPMGDHASSAERTSRFVPFTQSKPEMRLIGEDDTRHLTFYLTPDEAKSGGRLRLVYTNAVSVMPEGAILAASINERAVGEIPIRSPQGMLANELPLPQNVLVAGWNTVRLRAKHQHRVDCSIEASYELWTQLDPVTSGFIAQTTSLPNDLSAILSAGRNSDGETELRIIAPSGGLEGSARQSLPVVQALAVLLGRKDLRVIFSETEGRSPGIDLFIGDPSAPGLTHASREVFSNAPSGLSVQKMENNRLRLVLRGANVQAQSLALANAFKGPLQPILTSRRNVKPQPSINADLSKRVTLAETGYETVPFTGRLFRTSFDLVMPEDFYPGDYGSIDLKLNAATAPGLSPGAQIMVRVNDRAVTSHILYNPEGVTLKEKLLGLSLRAFHPGVNKVEILAELPHSSDKACDPANRHTAPRFLLLGETALDIPELARIGRLPDLAAFAGRAYPFNRQESFDLAVDAATPARLSTAATMLARLALASGRPLLANLIIGDPVSPGSKHALVIKAGPASLAMAETPASKVARLKPIDLDDLVTASVRTPVVEDRLRLATDSQALLDAFQVETALDANSLSWSSRLSMGFQNVTAIVNSWLHYQDAGETKRQVKSADTLVTLSQESSGETNAILTTLEAGNETDLLNGSKVLLEPLSWASLKGGTATVIRSDLSLVTNRPEVIAFHSLSDRSLGNLRRLAAAWLSDNFIAYVALILVFTGGFGLWLGYIVPRKGVRTVE